MQGEFTVGRKSSSGLALLIQYTTQLSNYLLFFMHFFLLSHVLNSASFFPLRIASLLLYQFSNIRMSLNNAFKLIDNIS